ncbi:Spy/CpxP family protein refolding chaperone [Aurantibacter sp.]|uniref:Spy/CpxP family protein refolding chaperone n=1 Tax=Aurantibacter sp. TaxID=2807103 RepID=UPI0035C80D31
MKKSISIIIFALCFSLTSFSQNKREKINTLKIAHITQSLNLSSDQAQKFWPIYNAYELKKATLRKSEGNLNQNTNSNNLSEADSKRLIENMLKLEAEKTSLQKKFITELYNVIPAKKIIKLIQAERSFKLKMIEEYKGRLRNRKGRN